MLEKGNPHSGGILKEDVLMVNFFLEPPAQIPRTNPGEFIFIIDRSGSMNGEKMQSAKETLLLFLKSLPENCYFNVIGFGSHFESLFQGGSQKYNEENLKKAEELQRQMEADMGGTEILKPLKHVFEQQLIETYPRQLFVLTDGEVSNTADVLKLAESNSQHCRVFTVGIGDGASTALVRGLAKAGKGIEVFVSNSERLQPKVISLLQFAMQPVATDVEITWDLPSAVTSIMMPPKIPYFFLGERQILYVMLSGTEGVDPSYVCSMTLKGKLLSKPFEYKETFTFHENTDPGTSAPIHRLAAKAQMKELQLNDAPKEQIVILSKSANVISMYTAFVMVDFEGKLVEGMSVERVVPTPTLEPVRTLDISSTITKSDLDADLRVSTKVLNLMQLEVQSCSSPLQGAINESFSLISRASDLMDFEESEEFSDTERMMDVITLQTFQGSWSLDTKLLGILKTDAEKLKQTIPLQDDYVVATVAVIAWLRKHHSERRDEWKMLETKALDWL